MSEDSNIKGEKRQRNGHCYVGCAATVKRVASFHLGLWADWLPMTLLAKKVFCMSHHK